jgi:hypothetical protein
MFHTTKLASAALVCSLALPLTHLHVCMVGAGAYCTTFLLNKLGRSNTPA